jgi:hypothetical protein
LRPLRSTGKERLPSCHNIWRTSSTVFHGLGTGTCTFAFHHDGFQLSLSSATDWTQLLPSPISSLTRNNNRVSKPSKHQPAPPLTDRRDILSNHPFLYPQPQAKKGPPLTSISIYYSNASQQRLIMYARHRNAVSPVPRYDLKPCNGLGILSIR